MRKGRWLGAGVAAFAVAVSLINASWIASVPAGKLTLVAHRALGQPVDREAAARDGCAAAHVLPGGEHNYIENSLPSIFKAARMGAAVELDVQPTADGQMVVFQDASLDCRTNGKGPVGARTLDVGYGYSPDGGTSFPLRGRGVGGMPTVEDVLREAPWAPIVFDLNGEDPRQADLLVTAFHRAGVKIEGKYGFQGAPAVLARVKALAPDAWTFHEEMGRACLADYLKLGWTGFVPHSCRNTTLVIPLDAQWKLWGWPNRFQQRMSAAGTRLVIVGPNRRGLDRPEQLGEVPRDFRGYLRIEDFYAIGRSLGR